jgi:hypothetical protein
MTLPGLELRLLGRLVCSLYLWRLSYAGSPNRDLKPYCLRRLRQGVCLQLYLSLHVFMAWCLIKHRNNISFYHLTLKIRKSPQIWQYLSFSKFLCTLRILETTVHISSYMFPNLIMHICTVLLPIKIALIFRFIGILYYHWNIWVTSMCVWLHCYTSRGKSYANVSFTRYKLFLCDGSEIGVYTHVFTLILNQPFVV